MKTQDISFFVVFVLLLVSRKPILFVWSGLLMLFLAIPLFAFHIFFTAERLTWYAAAFFLFFILFSFIPSQKGKITV